MFPRLSLAAPVALFLISSTASAHIHLVTPLSRTDALTGDQKEQHCGVTGQVRNPARVTTYHPGETITVTWMETINHPGHFRISFQPNGDTFTIPPAGNGPPSGFPSLDQTGMTDATTGSIVLKDFIADGTASTQITLPNMECANCTLQFIQVMTDKPPYTIDTLSDDVYFNCADITLSNVAPPMVDAGVPPANGDAGADAPGGGGGVTSSGCSTSSSGASLVFGLGLVGLLATRRRRR